MRLVAALAIAGAALVAAAAGLVAGVLFLRRQGRLRDPLVDLGLFRSARFSAALGVAVVAAFVMYGAYLLSTGFMQLVAGLSALEAGLWLVPSAIAVAISAATSATRPDDEGAGAITSAQTPSRCTLSTTGHGRSSPYGRRATSCASSRRKSTSSSASRSSPASNQSATSSEDRTTRTPLPS